ncbi:MAG: hypothetical protein HY982_01575 [Candidatus Magasanikbacteria bacterium]|nr:hypothetical protein [Candidatus Magasanikbacteria bacterium]
MRNVARFFKRLFWSAVFFFSKKRWLLKWLHKPDYDTFHLLWQAYAKRVIDIREFMLIVYADDSVFPRPVRVEAAQTAFTYLKREDGWRFLPDAIWHDPHNGRVAYLLGIALYLPDFREEADQIVGNLYDPDEQRVYFQMFQQLSTFHSPGVGYA